MNLLSCLYLNGYPVPGSRAMEACCAHGGQQVLVISPSSSTEHMRTPSGGSEDDLTSIELIENGVEELKGDRDETGSLKSVSPTLIKRAPLSPRWTSAAKDHMLRGLTWVRARASRAGVSKRRVAVSVGLTLAAAPLALLTLYLVLVRVSPGEQAIPGVTAALGACITLTRRAGTPVDAQHRT